MKQVLGIFILLYPWCVFAQPKDTMHKNSTGNFQKPLTNKTNAKPEILTSGFIDIINNGQVNAAARLIRLMIGEPGQLTIPLSVYSGVSSNNFQNTMLAGGQRLNDQVVTNFLNPLSGLFNVSLEGLKYFKKRKPGITQSGILYHAGIRLLTGYRNNTGSGFVTGKPINFLNEFATGGFYFQTGAWEKNNDRNMGICWMAFRYITCKSSGKQLRLIEPGIRSNGFYHGWSFAWGIDITQLLNVKFIFYDYARKPEWESSPAIYQFSFSYSLK
jgi:hypothetical protein